MESFVAGPVELPKENKGNRIAKVLRYLHERLEAPFPNAGEYVGPPEPHAKFRKLARLALGGPHQER